VARHAQKLRVRLANLLLLLFLQLGLTFGDFGSDALSAFDLRLELLGMAFDQEHLAAARE
jgi:hypothetical protein